MAWNFNNREAVYLQIANRMRGEILGGKYKPDEQIPPVRILAFEASVNPNTMQKALVVLEDEKLLYSVGTTGRFVTSDGDVLETAKKKMKKTTIKELTEKAKEAGIEIQELIDYMKEADNK